MTIIQKLHAKKSKKGFTLVELVIVIAILAILAAIAIPVVASVINSANESADKSDAATLDLACKNYHAKVQSGIITGDLTTIDVEDAMGDSGLKINLDGKTGNGFYYKDNKIMSAKEFGTPDDTKELKLDTLLTAIYGTGTVA